MDQFYNGISASIGGGVGLFLTTVVNPLLSSYHLDSGLEIFVKIACDGILIMGGAKLGVSVADEIEKLLKRYNHKPA
jgi:hypothetical protein